MKKLLNVVMAALFIAAKVQGVNAQEPIIEKNLETKTKIIESLNSKPSELGSILTINPYEFSTKKKADEQMKVYKEQVAKEIQAKEEERKKKAEEEAKKRQKALVASYKVEGSLNFADLYQKAGQAFGINPKVLQAVHIVETGGSGSTTRSSYAGATGPMQFMPATFRAYGVDGNGDGVADIHNVEDAIFSAANYLAKNRGGSDIRGSLWHYNHSYAYVDKVLSIAQSLGM